MSLPNGIETIEFQQPVPNRRIRAAVLQQIEGATTRPHLVFNKKRFRIGRTGAHLTRHLLVASTDGQAFKMGGSETAIRVLKYEWLGHATTKLRYDEGLHDYEVRWFAEKLARALGGTVKPRFYGKWPRPIPCCSGPGCREPAVYVPDYSGDACPRHGKAYELVDQLLDEPLS